MRRIAKEAGTGGLLSLFIGPPLFLRLHPGSIAAHIPPGICLSCDRQPVTILTAGTLPDSILTPSAWQKVSAHCSTQENLLVDGLIDGVNE